MISLQPASTLATHYPDLLAISGVREQAIPATDTHAGFEMHSLIKLVSTYPGATGLKTGYTDDAGYCLAGTATRACMLRLGLGMQWTSSCSKTSDGCRVPSMPGTTVNLSGKLGGATP